MILARLKKAIAEQNWFAVALEFLIVVLGVVIGFQVSLWGQEQADRKKGDAYLVQLVTDLNETEELLLDHIAVTRTSERSAGMLVKQFDSSVVAPYDSIYTWLGNAVVVNGPLPILSTAEALISTGDLGLIKDAEIRSAISAYLQRIRVSTEYQKRGVTIVLERMGAFMEVIDVRLGVSRMELDFRTDLESALQPDLKDAVVPDDPEGIGVRVPDNLERVFSDRKSYAVLTELAVRQADLSAIHSGMLSETRELLELIESKS